MKILKRLVFLFLAVITFIPVNTFPMKKTVVKSHVRKTAVKPIPANTLPLKLVEAHFSQPQLDVVLKSALARGLDIELDLSRLNIHDFELEYILNQIGENLITLIINRCDNLIYNFEAIKYCTQLQELELIETHINDEQLAIILNQIGGNLRMLRLLRCTNLHNFETIKNCINLQELDLTGTDINGEQLAVILNQIGGNLKKLWLWGCFNLHNVETIRNWARERNIKLYIQSKLEGNRNPLKL